MSSFDRLSEYLGALRRDIYPEPPSDLHTKLSRRAVEMLLARPDVRPGMRVLDLGCGQGVALELFRTAGLEAVGVTLGEDAAACRAKGLDVIEADFSVLDLDPESFDIVWCRHALEHSIFPLFTLSEMKRVTRPGGLIYVEVPAPDTAAHHERNPNHYSCFGKSGWLSLFDKAGLAVQGAFDIKFTLRIGPDLYWAFVLQRPQSA